MSVSMASGHVTSCDSCLSHRQTVWKRASGAQQCICIEGSDVMRECLSSALISFCHSDLRLFEWTQHAGRCCDVASFIFLSLSVERRKWHHIAADEWRTATNTNHKRWYWAGHAAGPLGSEGQRGRQGQDLLRIVFVPDVSLISTNTSVQLWTDLTLMCFHQLSEDTTTQQSCVTYRNLSFSFPALRLTVMHLLTHTDWSCREFKKHSVSVMMQTKQRLRETGEHQQFLSHEHCLQSSLKRFQTNREAALTRCCVSGPEMCLINTDADLCWLYLIQL